MQIYSGSPLLITSQAADRSNDYQQQRTFPPKMPDALYHMGPGQLSLPQKPTSKNDDEDDDDGDY